MQRGAGQVASGAERADQAGQALDAILGAVEATLTQVAAIELAADGLATGARAVIRAQAQELSATAAELRHLIARFTLDSKIVALAPRQERMAA